MLGVRDNGTEIGMAYKAEPLSAAGTIRYYAEAIDKVYGEIAPTGGGRAWPRASRAARRGRRDRAVEFPADDRGMEDRPRARCREFGRGQAAGARLAHAVAHCRAGGGGELAGRRVERRHRPRWRRRARRWRCTWMSTCWPSPAQARSAVGCWRCSARSNLKRVHLELGGKSPNIVFADVPDLKQAAKVSANGIFRNSGQVCVAGSRLLVQSAIL